MPSLTARAVLLDMDGTLVNSDAVIERMWRRWAARYGLDGRHVYEISHGRQSQETMADMLPGRPREQNLTEARELLTAEEDDTDGVVAVPGAAAFLAALAQVPHALVTSANDAVARTRMAAAGLPMPALVITSDQVSAGKPAPDGFLKAAAALGVEPAGCVVFEDSPAGLGAARAAGMRAVGVGPRALACPPEFDVADFTGLTVTASAGGGVRIGLPPG